MEINFSKIVFIMLMVISFNVVAETVVKDNSNSSIAAKSVSVNCNEKSKIAFISVPFKNYLNLLDFGKTDALAVDLSSCYLKGKSTKLFTFKFDKDWVYEKKFRGEVVIENAQQVDIDDAFKTLKIVDSEKIFFANRIKKRDYDSKKVWLITLKSSSLNDKSDIGGAPKNHPMVKVAKKSEVKAAIRNGAFIYDVRPESEYKKGSIKGAVNLSFTNFNKAATEVLSPTELDKNGLILKKSSLPKNKKEKIYIFSNCPGELLSYNASTKLSAMGYSNVYWYRQGFVNYKGKAKCFTPKKDDSIVDSAYLQGTLGDKKTVLLDLRNSKVNTEYTIKGAITAKMQQTLSESGLPLHRGSKLDATKLTKFDEALASNPVGKNDTPIIVFGADTYDWAPYKAMLYLKANGYKNVKWYRAGFNDWINKYVTNTQKYELNKNVARDKISR